MSCTELISCIERTTIHGVIHIAEGKTVVLRVMWIIALIFSSIAFAYYSVNNFNKYLRQDTSVSIDLRGTKFIPPDLHFCNVNPLSKSRLLNINENNLDWKHLKEDIRLIEESAAQAGIDDFEYSFFWSSINHPQLFQSAGHLLSQTIIGPSKLNQEWHENITEMTSNHQYFSCIRYTGLRENDFNGTLGSLVLLFYTDSYHLDKSSVTYENRSIDDIWYVISDGRFRPTGIYMYVTPHGGYPHVESHSVFISPGHHTTVKLKMRKTISANVKNHPCAKDQREVKYYNRLFSGDTISTYNASLSDCKYRRVLEKLLTDPSCQCIPFMVPVSLELAQKYPTCANVTDVQSNVSILEQFECITKYFMLDEEFNIDECNVERPCDTINYSSDVSKADLFPNDTIKFVLDLNETDENVSANGPGIESYLKSLASGSKNVDEMTSRNFAVAVIRAGETKSLLIEESVAYEVSNLIADIGGLAGLFLGVSFLTTLEFINLFHDIIFGKVRRQKLEVVED